MKNMKRRVLSWLLALVLVCTGTGLTQVTYGAEGEETEAITFGAVVPSGEDPVTFTVDGLNYTVTDADAKLVEVTGATDKNASFVNVLEAVTNEGTEYIVTSIGKNAFKGMKKLASVFIGCNVTSIGKNAFQNDKKLASISVSNHNLEKNAVGKNAFKGINKKAVFYVPNSRLNDYSFLKKKGQKSAKLVPFGTLTTIMYTNDIHCGVDGNIGLAGVAALKKNMEADGNDVILVDNGDSDQGGIIGTVTKGEAIVNIMNATGYDYAVPGNHDFDYGMDTFMSNAQKANYKIVCSNFKDLRKDEPVFDAYAIRESNGKKIAFIGVDTPQTIIKSTPVYFQDEDGNYIYSFSNEEQTKSLYETVQKAIDGAKAEGADICILMSHLGIGEDSAPYESTDLIANTTGLDAVLDGHSHTVMEKQMVKDKEGKEVLLTQTGTKLENVGILFIGEDGSLINRLIPAVAEKDPDVAAAIAKEEAAYEKEASEVLGSTDFDLVDKDTDGTRLIRNRETNLGDFCADAYRIIGQADIGIVNGGGIRASISKGDITLGNLISVFPFGNELCVLEVTGQTILDALEFGAMKEPGENGGFLQVSGLTYTIDPSIESPVKVDDIGAFDYIPEGAPRRVSNVQVGGEDIDPAKTYTVASHNYELVNGGDGYKKVFEGGTVVDLGGITTDMEVLRGYLDSLGGKIPSEYEDPAGEGRITILEAPANTTSTSADIVPFEKRPIAA